MEMIKIITFHLIGDIHICLSRMIFQALEPGNIALRHHAGKGIKR